MENSTTTPPPTPNASKAEVVVGWTLSILPSLMFLLGGAMAIAQPAQVAKGMQEMGWPAKLALPLGIVEIACAIIYLIPRTSVLGAILLTGYLGGAVATHARLLDWKFIFAVIFGVVIWLGLYLRHPRLRTLVPIHQ